ncbi:MAG: M3 family metallopeptidase [Planctomycetes bacterium]|nr:M3 family metallopeptidase [Planctomycetota bacterium]
MPETQTDLQNNPLLATGGLPLFDEIQPRHVIPAVRHVLQEAGRKLDELEKNVTPSWAATIEALDEIERPFEYAWGPVSHFFGVKNSAELREAYETVLPELVSYSLRVKQSEPIYKALTAIKNSETWQSLDEAQQRIIDRKLLSFELSGIGLEGEQRERFNEITQELSQLSTDFANHVLDATKAYSLILTDKNDVDGLPPSLLQLAAQSYNTARGEDSKIPADAKDASAEEGPWRITLDAPSFLPFMQHCNNSELRETLYREYITRASHGEIDNSEIISRILRLRHERAGLLGYRSHAEVSLAEKMAPSVQAVEEMFESLRAASWEPAQTDQKEIEELAKQNGVPDSLKHWDIAYWAERLREKRFDFTDEQLRPYFSLDRVLDGLFALCGRLFEISVTPADGEAALWHEDVRFFKLFDKNRKHIASFYLDPYSRPDDKRGGAWMDECFVRRVTSEGLQVPVAHLVCNATPPVGEKPSLMTFREVETLFHEFGHGLQQMLTTVDYPDAAGINGVEWDAVELPSQFMENWCYHKATLLGMTAHYETGEPLPEDLFDKICAARTYRSGTMMLRQLQFGMTDIALHSNFDPQGEQTPFDVQRQISATTSVVPMLPEDRSLCAFQHIFSGGYAAGYYSYKWAEVLSADAFSAFEEAGLDDEQAVAETGRRFRDTVLSLGGSRHPMELFKTFRGREPNPQALLRHSGLI